MIRRVLLAMAMCLGACARQSGQSAGAFQPGGDADKVEIVVGPGAFKDGEQVLGAWLLYGAAKAAAFAEHPPPGPNESADDFAIELAGREAQSEFWMGVRKEGAPSHQDLDKQVEVWRAGFLPELVISVHGRPGWTVPPAALAKLQFGVFVKKFAGNYVAGAPVVLRPPSGKPIPDVPGADFPDPSSLPMGQPSCARALEERKAAWTRFEALEKRLGGVAVSAETPVAFAHQLTIAQNETEHRKLGVTWVSPRVGYLAVLEGFCAVERKDWPQATRALARAVSLRPDDPALRLEWALALTAINRPDDALAQVTQAITLTKDGCVLGLAFRRRGYILIEKGALQAAEDAYKTSLKYDPRNHLAAQELAHVAQLRRERRARTPEPMVASVPPFGMTITECPAGAAQ